jgi:hypothetical protein
MKFRVWNLASPYVSSSIVTPLNDWYYVGFTYSSNTLTAYVNGQTAGSTTISRLTPFNDGGGVGLYYSLGYPTGTNMGGGGASTFRFGGMNVYNLGLTSSQVLQNYNNTKTKYIPVTPTPTPTSTLTPTPSVTPTLTPTNTITPTTTPTNTPTPSTTPPASSAVTFTQTFTSGQAPGTTIETAWTTFRGQLTGTYTKFDFTSSNGQGYTGITDSVRVQQLANALRTGTTGVSFATTISGVSWNVGCCACRQGGALNGAVEFANISLCSAGSTAALRPWINNSNWGGIGTTVNAATQTLTLKFY